jgi:hypothetical protein
LSSASALVSTPALDSTLQSTVRGLATFGYLSSASALVSTPALDSTLQSTVRGLATFGYLSSASALVSTPALDSTLRSTVRGLATFGYLSSASALVSTPNLDSTLQSTVRGLATFGYLSAGTTVLISSPALDTVFQSTLNGLGSLQYLSTQALNSTTYGFSMNFTTSSLTVSSISFGNDFGFLNLGDVQTDVLSSSRVYTSSLYINNSYLKASTYISSVDLQNLQINNLYVNTFGPVRVAVSTLGAAHADIQAYDISKYFLFTQTNAGYSVALPTFNVSFEGWNCVIRNMPDSTQSFAISTVKNPPAGTNIAPGTTVTVLGSGNSYYLI